MYGTTLGAGTGQGTLEVFGMLLALHLPLELFSHCSHRLLADVVRFISFSVASLHFMFVNDFFSYHIEQVIYFYSITYCLELVNRVII
jgi:hypothetical protein